MPQIKQDLNRAGWESTDFPSVCERCLPDSPYVQMLKSEYDAECKVCTRPFTLFTFKADRTSRQKRTTICLTCARLKNCCQVCLLDLSFGLPVAIRDAALKMTGAAAVGAGAVTGPPSSGPASGVNREYFAQNAELAIKEGRAADPDRQREEATGKAVELLRKIASSEPYRRRREGEGDAGGRDDRREAGPVRTRGGRGRGRGRGRGSFTPRVGGERERERAERGERERAGERGKERQEEPFVVPPPPSEAVRPEFQSQRGE